MCVRASSLNLEVRSHRERREREEIDREKNIPQRLKLCKSVGTANHSTSMTSVQNIFLLSLSTPPSASIFLSADDGRTCDVSAILAVRISEICTCDQDYLPDCQLLGSASGGAAVLPCAWRWREDHRGSPGTASSPSWRLLVDFRAQSSWVPGNKLLSED